MGSNKGSFKNAPFPKKHSNRDKWINKNQKCYWCKSCLWRYNPRMGSESILITKKNDHTYFVKHAVIG